MLSTNTGFIANEFLIISESLFIGLKDSESALNKDTHFLEPTATDLVKPVSISYAVNYLDSEFEAPFSEEENEEKQRPSLLSDTLKPDFNSTFGGPLPRSTCTLCSNEDLEPLITTTASETISLVEKPLPMSPPGSTAETVETFVSIDDQSIAEKSEESSQTSEPGELSPVKRYMYVH